MKYRLISIIILIYGCIRMIKFGETTFGWKASRINMSGYKSIIGIDYHTFDHLHPLPRSLRFEVVGLLFICYGKYFTLNTHWRIFLQQDFSLLFSCLGAIVHQLRSGVQNHHPFFEIAKKHFLVYYAGKYNFLLHFLIYYHNSSTLFTF